MVKTEEDWFEEELVYEFIDIRETGNYHDKHCEFDPDKHPERRELYNMLQFAYLYLEDNKRYEEYKKTGRVVLKGLDNSVKDWKEYFETKFETAMKTMDDRLRAELLDGDYSMQDDLVYESLPWVMGNVSKLFDVIPYAKLDLETEKRFFEGGDDCGYSYDDIPQYYIYSRNRQRRIKLMLNKAARLKKQKEELEALNPPNYLHLVDYVEKLNQYEIPKPVIQQVVKPVIKPVVKPSAKTTPKAALEPISVAKKINVNGKENMKPKAKVSKVSKVPVKLAKKVNIFAKKYVSQLKN
ncbi:hypothetical protein DAPK24_055370 [Pichia kluyveri]|uniref:J domain-containing protein n=1 Tax=Pichia kluyveri TaxID=36015 RepID=A0AAV5RBH6_PICKL|nr:hypothetical protein DAPK24_055370 [Pichia kluyveri]